MREATFILSAGMPEVGKSYANKEQAKKVLYGNPDAGVKPRKVLVVDSQDEYDYHHPFRDDMRKIGLYAKLIHVSQVKNFSNSKYIECCRINNINDQGRPMSLSEINNVLDTVLNEFRNGLLIVEDFKQFASASIRQELVNKLCTRRHGGTDTLVSLQGVGQITPILWQNLKWLRLHKTTDSITVHKEKVRDKMAYLCIGENMVNEKFFTGDERFRLMIDLSRGFIYGKYNQADFIEAAKKYIYANWASTTQPYINYLDEEGNKMFDKKSVVNQILKQYTLLYSQFSPRLQKK